MEYYFELFLHVEKLEKEDWKALNNVISSQVGTLNEYRIIITVKDNTVRYFIGSFIDLGPLSNNINIGILKPVDRNDINLPEEPVSKKEKMVIIQQGESVFDIRERYQIKKSLDLEAAVLRIRKINTEKALTKVELYFKDKIGTWSLNSRRLTTLPTNLLAIDFKSNTKYLRSKIGKYLDIQKTLGIMQSENIDAIFEAYTFPYLPKNYYLPITSYDFDKHSLIVGASGSGKSKLISLFIDRLNKSPILQEQYRVIVIDPHAALEEDLGDMPGSIAINFKDQEVETELFASSDTDIQAATELTATLFKSLLQEQHSPNLERVLKHSIYILTTAQVMSLDNLKRFTTDIEYRNQLIDHVKGFVPENIINFFGTDFNELRTRNYNEAIAPVVSFVEEIQLQPSLSGGGDDKSSLAEIIEQHNTTVFSLNKISMGEKAVKTVAGLLIQQIFLLAQARAFNKKIILVIDEVSVVQNPTIASILSEARKFNLSVILTQQYFGQIENGLKEAIFSNVLNYYAFKVSEDDAKALEGNLSIDIPKEILEAEKANGLSQRDIRVQMLTNLHPRDALVRLSSNGKILPCIKVRTLDFEAKGYSQKSVTLEPVQKSNNVPEKFVESTSRKFAPLQEGRPHPTLTNSAPTPHSVTETNISVVEKIIDQAQQSIQTEVQQKPKKVSMSIEDLLASSSSSRKKLK